MIEHVMSHTCECEDCRKVFRPIIEERLENSRKFGTPIAKRIEIEYDNGEIWRAVDSDAFEIVNSWRGAQVMEHIHGRPYTGPTMKKVDRP